MVSGSLITRNYTDFRGVDFSNKEVSLVRSPDSLNMWKNYKNSLGKCIETRPDIEQVGIYDNTIYGLFFYKVGNTEMEIVHCGTKLYRVEGNTKTELFTGMKPAKSNAFVYNNMFYIKDGINYLKYDGKTCSQVVGYIPTTSIGRKPVGGGSIYQDVNMLSAYRKNTFLGDGESTEYFLDAQNIDGEAPIVKVNGDIKTYGTDFNYDTTSGKVTFTTAPSKPLTDGQDNVEITYKKTVSGYADRINKCTLLQVFDNRVFFSGNQDYPNTLWHSSLNDPSYCSDLDYYNEGLDLAPVKSMVAGNNALWVFKEPSQANTTVFYHNPVIDSEYGKVYPSTHSSISTGCIATGINFNDDIVFFSDRGMEAINGDVTTEQVVAHRSSLIDNKLLNESNYKDMILEEWEGYLLVIIDNKVYLADSRAMFTNENHNEYEWFYWELSKNITCTQIKDGILYLGTDEGIYKFKTDDDYDAYKEVEFTKGEDSYYLEGQSVQNESSIKNTYPAGKYKTVIDGKEYKFTLLEDLRSAGDIKDKIEFKNKTFKYIKNVNNIVLDGTEEWKIYNTESAFKYCYFVELNDKKVGFQTSTSSGFVNVNNSYSANLGNVGYYSDHATNRRMYFDTDKTTVDDWKTWLTQNNIDVNYGMDTPEETNLDYSITPYSYWTTPEDEFKYPQYQKTTNKRGCVIDMTGAEVKVSVKTDNKEFDDINTYTNAKGYVVSRIKKKKWKSIQIKFSSGKPFGLYSSTLEAYVGGYLKR